MTGGNRIRAIGLRVVLTGLSVAILLTGQAGAADSRYPEKEHLPVDFSQMEATGFDETAFQDALGELRKLCASPEIKRENAALRDRVAMLYRRIITEFDRLNTQTYLSGIRHDADGADQKTADEAAALSIRLNRAYDECYKTLRKLLDTPYEDIVAADAGSNGMALLQAYRPVTEQEFRLSQEEERLVNAYEQQIVQPVQVAVNGQTWTEETLYSDSQLDGDAYMEILELLERARNESVGEIFRQLVQVRTEIAREAGYSNYADYAYREVYNRDYTTEDIQRVYTAAKTHWTELDAQVRGVLNYRALRVLSAEARAGSEKILDTIQPYMERIDPELADTFAFMRAYHLYDMDASDSKLPVGYTVSLPSYGTAFIFDSPYGDYQDYNTAIHEFGHFNETFHCTQNELWSAFNIDVGEIHSQGLEVLYTSFAEDLFGDGGQAFYWATLSSMINSVLDGCMYDEFQNAIYQDPDMELDEINRLFKDISEQYGYFYADDAAESWFWTENPHMFQSPMYYISYATSALSAIDLWLLSVGHWDQAVETYLDLSVLSLSKPYRETIREVGLQDIFRPGVVRSLAKKLEIKLGADFYQGPVLDGDHVAVWLGGAGAIAAVGIAAALLLKKARASAQEAPEEPWL